MPDETQLLAVIDAYSDQSYGSDTDGGELSRQRSLALDAYQGKNIEPAPEGRSQVTDWSMFETVQWILPSLTRIFASGDNIVEFEPEGPDDEEVAEQESEYVNHLVTQQNNWFLTCLEWFQDALITKNAYCMAFMEEKITPEKERYEGQTAEQLAMLLEDGGEIVAQEERVDEENPEPVIDPTTGQPAVDELGQPIMQPRVVFDVEVRRTTTKAKLRFQVLPPERCLVDQDTPDFTLDDCNYFEYWEILPISDIRKMGFEVDDDIASDVEDQTSEDTARDDILHGNVFDRADIPDPSLRRVKVRTVWVRHDYDEDGIAELQKVIVVGREILERDEVNTIPVASIVPFLNTHRHMGMSVGDLTFDIQRIKTALLRSSLDSTYLSLNPEKAISNKVNTDDLLVSRPGGLKRIDTDQPDVQGHIMDLAVPYVAPQGFEGMSFMDRVIESRVGVSRMFQGIDESNLNDHNRVGQLSTMAAQRVEQIARVFGNGVERLFRIAHELVIKSGHKMEAIRLRGKWVDIDPSQWRTGRDMRVVAPFAAGNKDALVQRLMMIAQIHEKALAGGLPIVNADDAYKLALEISKAADLPGDRFFTDPSTVPPAPEPPDHTMIALEIEDKKANNEAEDEARQAELKRYEADVSAELDKYKADLQAQTQLALAQIKAGQSVDLEKLRANLRETPIEIEGRKLTFEDVKNELEGAKGITQELEKALAEATQEVREISEELRAPREVVRENGKVVGIKIGNKIKPVNRDESGRITGV